MTTPRRAGSAARMPDASYARQRAADAVTRFIRRRLAVPASTAWDGDELVVRPGLSLYAEQIAQALADAGVPVSYANPYKLRVLAWWETVAETLAR